MRVVRRPRSGQGAALGARKKEGELTRDSRADPREKRKLRGGGMFCRKKKGRGQHGGGTDRRSGSGNHRPEIKNNFFAKGPEGPTGKMKLQNGEGMKRRNAGKRRIHG